jgi:hypothetical protein
MLGRGCLGRADSPQLTVMLYCHSNTHMRLIAPLLVLAALIGATAHAAPPERIVRGNSIVSRADPHLRITVPHAAMYVGADRWNLYDVADCEIHVFVEADKARRVTRFYWIQFEAYLPSHPDFYYDYPSPPNTPMQLWNRDFQVRARFGPTGEVPKAGSDLERVQQLIAKAGYTLPPHMLNVRMVHLGPKDAKGRVRSEMILFYNEDMAPTGMTSMDFITGDGGPGSTINAK